MTEDDASFVYTLFNSPKWLQYIGDREIRSVDDAKAYIKENIMPSYTEMGFGFYKMCLKENGQTIGICGIVKRDYLDHVDIGYAILPQFEGKGYTSEAAKAMLEHGKYTLKLHPILAITAKDNLASQQLLNKIGLKKVGLITTTVHPDKIVLFST